jgi:calreticulin
MHNTCTMRGTSLSMPRCWNIFVLHNILIVFGLLLENVSGTIYFYETFDTGNSYLENKNKWKDRWVESTSHEEKDRGLWEIISTGTPSRFDIEVDTMASYKFPGEQIPAEHLDYGLKTATNYSYYGISAKLDKPFYSHNKSLYIQFSVRLEQLDGMDCGGAYIKVFPSNIDQKNLDGKTPYIFMFGPDICGAGKQFTQFILGYDKLKFKRQKHAPQKIVHLRKKLHCETDKLTHLYTLVVKPDNTYEYRVDHSRVDGGYLEEDFDILPKEKILDTSAKKPSDWEEDSMLPDPNHVMPPGYGKEPKYIPDPSATKPSIWNDDEDGVWESPLIINPSWQGDWEPKMIRNPNYKGSWVPPYIANPEYDSNEAKVIYDQCNPCEYVGFDLWQVDAGTIFDDILITDSESEAQSFAHLVMEKKAWEIVSNTPSRTTNNVNDQVKEDEEGGEK